MNEMSSLEELLLGENYLAKCQQLLNLIQLLSNSQLLQQQQQHTQLAEPQESTTSLINSHCQPMPNSVLQILQHLQDNQDLQQLQQRQREQYRLQVQQQQRLYHQQQRDLSQQPSNRVERLAPRCADQQQAPDRLQRHHYHSHRFHQQPSSISNNCANSNAANLSSSLSPGSSLVTSAAVAAAAAPGATLPSSTLLAKLTAATSRPCAQFLTTKLDQTMIDFLQAIYAINDNPEPAAIDMLSKRLNTTSEAISDWFDETRLKLNPSAGPRSPPAKKRQGGRVVTFSEYQRSLLEAIFDENNYLHPQEYEELSNLIQVPSRNIKIWFKNRRSKQRLSGRVNTPGSLNNSD